MLCGTAVPSTFDKGIVSLREAGHPVHCLLHAAQAPGLDVLADHAAKQVLALGVVTGSSAGLPQTLPQVWRAQPLGGVKQPHLGGVEPGPRVRVGVPVLPQADGDERIAACAQI